MGPDQYARWLRQVMYNKRTKVNPLWNVVVIGGVKKDEKPVLKYVDLFGMTFEEDFMASGLGGYMAMPLMRKEWKPDMTEAEARALLTKCLQVLFYRDCRASNRVQFSIATKDKVEIEEPIVIDHFWSHPSWLKSSLGGEMNSDSW